MKYFWNKENILFSKDHLKPIFISQGQDTISSSIVQTSANLNAFEVIKKQMGALFSNEESENKSYSWAGGFNEIFIREK